MIPTIYLSHRLEALVDRLVEELDAERVGCLQTQTILVPNQQVKQWLLLEIAKRKGIAMGLRVLEIEQIFKHTLSKLEMFCLVYQALGECEDPQLKAYLDGKNRRLLELTEQLTALFFKYGQFGAHLFEEAPKDWQGAILHKLFVQGSWRLPIQTDMKVEEPIWCFGIDYTPFWNSLFHSQKLSVFLFSPCKDFWEDLCTEWERKKLNRYWKKRGATKTNRDQLDAYLREAPPMLANWGKLGRETLTIFDAHALQMEEVYPPLEPKTLLNRIQYDLLNFQVTQKGEVDSSVKVFLTGSSRLKEIECLRDEILHLEIPYHEIAVLAPDIELYVPLIEFVFGDAIPYRISGFDIAPQSSFRQGLIRLVDLASGRWEAEDVLTLFETPAFYRKQSWDEEKLEIFREWLGAAHINWGKDAAQRKDLLTQTLGEKEFEDTGSWERGLDRLLEALIYLKPLQLKADEFEEFLGVVFVLKELPLKGEKTMAEWAHCMEGVARDFLLADTNDEADAATQNAFRQFLQDLRQCRVEGCFPFAIIQRLLKRPCFGQIHGSHLHAVRFSSIEEGLPARALFLIGMDEESFPRLKSATSLDLLKGQTLNQSDHDRYLFLQAIFSAREYLRISYGHLSPDEGKPVGPSLVVQELLSAIGDVTTIYKSSPPVPYQKQASLWSQAPGFTWPEGEITIPISDLRLLARHPWKFYLQKVQGIYLNEPLEESFALQKGQLLRAIMEKPIEEVLIQENLPSGLLGQAMKLEIEEKEEEWKRQFAEWGVKPFKLIFRENCAELQWEEETCVVPPIELSFEKCKVRIVGEIKQATEKGLICTYDDKVDGILKVWPEALAVGMALHTPQVLMLRNGKTKNLVHIEQQLKAFIEYYFCASNAPSPLLTDWADALLRKGEPDLAKMMEKGSQFEDPVIEWVLARNEISAHEVYQRWGAYLKEAFGGLADLYPTRGKSHADV